jgi:hypothetical protein
MYLFSPSALFVHFEVVFLIKSFYLSKKKMRNSFLIVTAHTTPPHQIDPSLVQIIMGQNPTPSCGPRKERHSPWVLNLPNALPWKRGSCETTTRVVMYLIIMLLIVIKNLIDKLYFYKIF